MTAERADMRRVALVAAAAVGLTTGMGSTLVYSLGTLMPYLIEAKGWERGQISFALTLLTLGIFTAGPVAGRLSDRYGAALIGTASLVGYALLVIAMAFSVGSIESFWFFYFVVALVGAGSTPIVLLRPIAASFTARRGLAIGFALTGAGLAGFWLPITIQPVAERFGWQGGYMAIAIAALVAAPLVWLGFRGFERPAALAAAAAAATNGPAAPVAGMTLAEAIRTRRFWILAVGGVAMAVGVGGLVVHLFPLLVDLDMPAESAARTASLVGLASVAGRLCVGYLLDRLPTGAVALGVLGLAAAGAVALWTFGRPVAPLSAILLGFAAGSEVDLIAYMTARYFGRRAYGAIYGWQYSIFALGYGFSPFVVGRLRDVTGNYDVALLLGATAMLIGAAVVLTLSRRGGEAEAFARASAEPDLQRGH